MFAAVGGAPKALRWLLDNGASDLLHIFYVDACGRTALHHAAAGGSVECVQALLDARSATGVPDKAGKTPVDYAQEHGHTEVVRLLEDVIRVWDIAADGGSTADKQRNVSPKPSGSTDGDGQ